MLGADDDGPQDDSLRFLFISAPEGTYVVTFQDDTVDIADFTVGLSLS